MPFQKVKDEETSEQGYPIARTAKAIKEYATDKSIGIGREIFQYLSSPLRQKYIKTVYFCDIEVNFEDDKRYVSTNGYSITAIWFNALLNRKNKVKSFGSNHFLEFPYNGIYFRKINNTTVALIFVYEEFVKDNNEYDQRMKIQFIGKDAQKTFSKLITKVSNNNESIIKYCMENGVMRYKNVTGFAQTICAKNIDEIFMNNDKRTELLSSINTFISNKIFYNTNKIPYKIGYLFYGPPGTGKTSLAYAIAYYLDWPVVLISPEVIYRYATNDDKEILLPGENRIVLLEEIDTMMKEYEISSSNNEGPSGALRRDHILKFIDDLPTGTILIANTNHFDKLDEAVIRSGRFDIKMEIPNFEKPEALQMIRYHNLDDSFADKYTYPVCPSDLQFDIVREISKTLVNRKDDDNE